MSSSSDPPPPNPVLTAYEGFIERTPLVTRSILSIQVVSYIFSWFVNPHYALANIPQFTLFQFEIYRVLLSPLVNTSFFSLIFAFLSFMEHGKRLEHSMGSTAFAWLCMTIGCLTNGAFLLLSLVLYLLSGQDTAYMFASAAGIWLILFGIIAIECIQAPRTSLRRLFFFEVPVLYYPFAIYAFFALLSASLSFSYLLSIGVGYAYGYGFLDKTKLSASKAKQWEETILANFTSREGWVVGHAATGSDAWNESSETGLTLPSFSSPQVASGGDDSPAGAPRAGSVFRTGPTSSSEDNSSSAALASATGGRTLGGGATRRGNADARSARLQALDRHASEESSGV